VAFQRLSHLARMPIPPLRRVLDVGEQERHRRPTAAPPVQSSTPPDEAPMPLRTPRVLCRASAVAQSRRCSGVCNPIRRPGASRSHRRSMFCVQGSGRSPALAGGAFAAAPRDELDTQSARWPARRTTR
jgi:hypothetical protein